MCYKPSMIPPFDIFRLDSTGQLVWQSSAETLALAQQRIASLMASLPSDYVIFSQKTGRKTVVSRTLDSIDSECSQNYYRSHKC